MVTVDQQFLDPDSLVVIAFPVQEFGHFNLQLQDLLFLTV